MHCDGVGCEGVDDAEDEEEVEEDGEPGDADIADCAKGAGEREGGERGGTYTGLLRWLVI